MDKSIIRQQIISQQEEAVSTLQKGVDEFHESADIDEQEGHDPEDYVHQQEATELWKRMETQLEIAESDLAEIKTIPLDPCNTVKKGALIETDYLNFYVGISSLPFQLEERKVVGISTHAPIFLRLRDKNVGDEVSIGPKKYKIKAIK